MKVFSLSFIFSVMFVAQIFCTDYTVTVEDTLKADLHNKSDVLGTNLALWTKGTFLKNKVILSFLNQLGVSDVRIPGGSWSNEYYWNGNGVRDLNNFDLNKRNSEGTWSIDYSGYQPGFRVEGDGRDIASFHGNLDVLSQHQWIEELNASAFLCLNVGSGNTEMAKEWLKWANENNFSLSRAEIGNELNGEWELGNELENGENMTAEIYAEIFRSYSNSLKKYDKELLIGGPASSDLNLDFCETLIKEGGTDLDFVSFHAYPVPVSAKTNKEKFAAIDEVRDPIRKIKQWINHYQPLRSNDIQIGISEWNMKVLEDVDTSSFINGLWSTCWLGTLYEEGVDFANQWDLSTEKKNGGHSMFNVNKEGVYNPKSIYWSMWIWNNLMGSELINSEIVSKNKMRKELFCFSTRSDEAYQIMLVNSNADYSIEVALELPKTIKNKKYRNAYTFTNSEYFWNPFANQVHWSNSPRKINLSSSKKIKLKPFSLVLITFEDVYENTSSELSDKDAEDIEFEIILPNRMPKNRVIEGWVTVSKYLDGRKSASLGQINAILEIEFANRVIRNDLKINNGLAKINIPASNEDLISIRCFNLNAEDDHEIEQFSQKLLPVIEWSFDDSIETWGASSTFQLDRFTRLKPNQSVASIEIINKLPSKNEDILFHFEPLNGRVSHEGRINGLFGEVSANDNFICNDENARIQFVFQSNSDHWIPMGSILLTELRGGWDNFKFASSSLPMDEKLSEVYGLRIRLDSRSKFTGKIYLNDLGFIYKLDQD
jgi:alpha-L-arabinofuranosidase